MQIHVTKMEKYVHVLQAVASPYLGSCGGGVSTLPLLPHKSMHIHTTYCTLSITLFPIRQIVQYPVYIGWLDLRINLMKRLFGIMGSVLYHWMGIQLSIITGYCTHLAYILAHSSD